MAKDYRIFIGELRTADVGLPASKSVSNRVLMLDALAGGGSRLENIADCDDTGAMLRALSELESAAPGGKVRLNVGAAGTAMRFLTAFAALKDGVETTIDGSPRMRERPIGVLADALCRCGAEISYSGSDGGAGKPGFPPLKIVGRKLKASGPLCMRGDVSSQYVSAMMMIAPCMEGGLTISLSGEAVSRPYIGMTAALMRRFGAEVSVQGNEIRIEEGRYAAVAFAVESDWSAASYWYELKAVFPWLPVRLFGLRRDSLQGDSRVAELFRALGVETEYGVEGVTLCSCPEGKLSRFEADLSGQPDLAQTLAVACCLTGMPFRITGLSTLRIKETDRIGALQSQLEKLGYPIHADGGCSLCWDGTVSPPLAVAPEIHTFSDHRMAMAFAPAAVRFPGLVVRDAGVVNKSYPDFWRHLAAAGFRLEEKISSVGECKV